MLPMRTRGPVKPGLLLNNGLLVALGHAVSLDKCGRDSDFALLACETIIGPESLNVNRPAA